MNVDGYELLEQLNRGLEIDVYDAWSEERGRMEMFVRSLEAQTVTLRDLGLTVEFDEGETLRTEISTKFTREGAEAELTAAGLRLEAWWTDEAGDFALCLAKLAQST